MNLYFRLLMLRLTSLVRPRLGAWDDAVTPFRVLPTDLDVLRHMNNGKFLTIMDLGRLDLMLRSGLWGRMTRRGWYPVVAGQTITYRKSLNPWQRFELHTRFLGFHDTWAYVEQSFRVGDTVYAQAVVRARFLRRTGGSVEAADLEEMAGPSPDGRQLPDWVIDWTAATKPRRA